MDGTSQLHGPPTIRQRSFRKEKKKASKRVHAPSVHRHGRQHVLMCEMHFSLVTISKKKSAPRSFLPSLLLRLNISLLCLSNWQTTKVSHLRNNKLMARGGVWKKMEKQIKKKKQVGRIVSKTKWRLYFSLIICIPSFNFVLKLGQLAQLQCRKHADSYNPH